MSNSVKIQCVGNSFSEDTTRYVAEIAISMGFADVVVANLYIGGCPIHKHYENMKNDSPVYRYDRNTGSGWVQREAYRISDAIQAEGWDWISIQHGSSYGGSYTEEESYSDLPQLVQEIKKLAGEKTKIAFNMTWTGEATYDHREMLAFHRNQKQYFRAICTMTQKVVTPVSGIDCVCPTGTAVQNARTTELEAYLNRDGYHLSRDHGCYLAGVTFLCALTGESAENASWRPQNVTVQENALILKAVSKALVSPYTISDVV